MDGDVISEEELCGEFRFVVNLESRVGVEQVTRIVNDHGIAGRKIA